MSPVFHFPGMGTLVNMLLIIGGSLIGMFFGKRFPQRVREIVMQASGLVVLFIGVSGLLSAVFTVDGQTYLGGTNIGSKPTFGDTAPSVETFILDFCGDIYGRDVKLAFFKRLRGIKDFGSAEALAAQLGRDKENIRALFAEEYQ